jgi:hypothetical protein
MDIKSALSHRSRREVVFQMPKIPEEIKQSIVTNEQVPSFANNGTLLPFDDNIVAAGRRQCVYAMKSMAFDGNITVVCCPIEYCRTAGNKVRQRIGLFSSRSSLLLTRKKFLAGPNLQIVEINKLHR